jgi:hypothetical protein
VVGGDGMFSLARLQASSGRGGLSGLHADPIAKRRQCPRTREHQGGQSARALDEHGVGVEWAALAAGQRPAWLVSGALREWWDALATAGDGRCGPSVTHGALAPPRARGDTRGSGASRRRNAGLRRRHASVWGRVAAARCMSGPAQHAVVEMGAPPLGLPARVARGREQRVTGVGTRTERRALETRRPNAQGSRQAPRGHGTGSLGVEPRMMVRVASALRGSHTPCSTGSPEHENACMKAN